MKLTILSRYSRLGASSRLRSLQYVPSLERAGIDIEVLPFFDDAYLIDLYAGRRKPMATFGYFAKRLSDCRVARGSDLLWVEKEVLPWMPWAIERAVLPRGVPYVVDYDDAVFHRYDRHQRGVVRWALGQKIDRVMQAAGCVTAGNAYLAKRAYTAGARHVQIVPTVVDLARYDTSKLEPADGALRVGWIGTPQTWSELARPIHAILSLELAAAGAVFRAVGAEMSASTQGDLEVLPWSEDTEVDMIKAMDIGIMPLPDTPWTRGKCGYKLIQYMACGLPVIASPVGVNSEIVEHGVNGFLADTPAEWREAVSRLLSDKELRERMGATGRKKVEAHFSLQAWSDRLAAILLATGRPN